MSNTENQDSNNQSASEPQTENATESKQPIVVGGGGEPITPSDSGNAAAPKKKKLDLTNGILIAIILAAVGFAANSFDLLKFPSLGGQKIAVIDTRLLIMSVSKEVNDRLNDGKINLQQSQYEINTYMDKLYEEAKEYAADGYTVIPSQNTMFYSDKHDITPQIAKKLGVSYDDGLKELERLELTNRQNNLFKKHNLQMQNNTNANAPTSSQGNVNFEDHSNLDLTIEGGQTSDLALFENN